MPNPKLSLDDETIHQIFGHEAAENENIERLRDYYFKGQIFERISANLPLRLLVGHKGVGKSALFAVAMREDSEAGTLALLIRPDDVHEIRTDTPDFLEAIRNWKIGLLRIIYEKSLHALGTTDPDITSKSFGTVGRLLEFLSTTLKPLIEQAVSLDAARKKITESFLQTQRIRVYLDDLDRGWKGDGNGISRLSALLNALRDLATDGLQFRVALRSDVYYLVRTSDESTDKVEGSVVWHTWSNHEILAMLVKRVERFFGRSRDESMLMEMRQRDLAAFLDPVLEPVFQGRGKWEKCPTYRMLMSLIRRRPRDLVKLCTLAAQHAHAQGRNQIETGNWDAIFEHYSQGRLQDTTNEFRSELPDVERLLLNMKPNKQERRASSGYVYTTEQLLKKISGISEQGVFKLASGKVAATKELAHFMYKINFLTARKDTGDGTIVRKYFEENKYLSSSSAEFGFDWEVHPAYRWALQPDDPSEIFKLLLPTADD